MEGGRSLKPTHDRVGSWYSQIAVIAPVVFMTTQARLLMKVWDEPVSSDAVELRGTRAAVGLDTDCTQIINPCHWYRQRNRAPPR